MQVLFEQSAPALRHVFLLRPCKLVATRLLHLIVCHLNLQGVPDEGRVIKLPVRQRRGNTSQPIGSSRDRSRFDPALVASCAAAELFPSEREEGGKVWLIYTSEGNGGSPRETDGFRRTLRPELDLGH